MATQLAGRPLVRRTVTGGIVWQVLVALATIATIAVNGLANALPINNLTTGEISDRFMVYFVPAGYVFSIWGLIYLGLLGYTVFQALPSQRNDATLAAIAPVYVLSALANMGWIALWHYEQFVLTLPVMLVLLGSLIAIYRRIYLAAPVARSVRLWVGIPFSIYLGWITVATVANGTALLDFLQWNGWGLSAEVWFGVMLAAATVIGAGFAWLRRDVAYVAVLLWAFAGIAVKHSANAFVAGSSIGAAVLLAVLLVVAWVRRRD